MNTLTGEQLRAGRAALRMEQQALADRAGVSVETIKRLERIDGPLHAKIDTLRAIRKVLSESGVELLDEDLAGGYGFRFSKDPTKRIRDEVCSELSIAADEAMKRALRADPDFFNKDPDHVAAKIEESTQIILRKFLKRRVRSRGGIATPAHNPTQKIPTSRIQE